MFCFHLGFQGFLLQTFLWRLFMVLCVQPLILAHSQQIWSYLSRGWKYQQAVFLQWLHWFFDFDYFYWASKHGLVFQDEVFIVYQMLAYSFFESKYREFLKNHGKQEHQDHVFSTRLGREQAFAFNYRIQSYFYHYSAFRILSKIVFCFYLYNY